MYMCILDYAKLRLSGYTLPLHVFSVMVDCSCMICQLAVQARIMLKCSCMSFFCVLNHVLIQQMQVWCFISSCKVFPSQDYDEIRNTKIDTVCSCLTLEQGCIIYKFHVQHKPITRLFSVNLGKSSILCHQ